jgi:hypothetical protein
VQSLRKEALKVHGLSFIGLVCAATRNLRRETMHYRGYELIVYL